MPRFRPYAVPRFRVLTSPARMVMLLIPILLAVEASDARAQQAAVQGIVTDAASAEPLPAARVVMERAGREVRSVRTDRNGFYQIAGLPPGAYQLHITVFGYLAHVETVELASGERLTANRGVAPAPLQLVGVAAGAPGGSVQRELGRQTITARDLGRIPTPAGSGDLVGYLQTMPGVVSTGDRGGQLLIRGGTPSENLVLMDGMLLYQPFHITGFFSAFPEELVGSAEFYPGGFGAKYSGRVSSVLDVRMRDGSRTARAVTASVSPFLAELTAEGPVGASGAGYSYIASARRSLIEETSPWLLGEEQPLRSSSYYLKLSSLARDSASRCSLSVMRSTDRGGLDPDDAQSRVGWSNLAFGGRCGSLSGEVFIESRFGYSRLDGDAITRGASRFTTSASHLYVDSDVSRSFGRVRLEAGGFAHFEDMRFDAVELFSQVGESGGYGGMGVYAEATIPLGDRIRLVPGATASWFPQVYLPTVEPRLRAGWQPRGRPGEELSGAVGLYTQRLAGVTDRRDAGSVFTLWMRPDTMISALHAQLSWQQSLGAGFSWSVDGYYRRMSRLPVTTWSTFAAFSTELSLADGKAHGGDARIEMRRGPFYGFAGYGYGWIRYASAQDAAGEWFGEPVLSYHPGHDRRHQANLLASLQVARYTLAARWEFGSGFPYTQPLGFDELFDFREDLPDVRGRYGATRVLVDRPFDGRMPHVHRLDLSAERSFEIGSRQLTLQAGVINAYDRANIFYYDVFTNRRLDQLPRTPYASLKLQPRGRSR